MKSKSMKIKIILTILAALNIITGIQNTYGVERPQASSPSPRLFFRTLGVGVDAADIFYIDSNKLKPCTVDSQRRSPYYDYSSSETPIIFVRVVKTADGKDQSVRIGQANIDQSSRRVLLIFYRSGQSRDTVQVMTLKDEATSVPPGGYRVVNLSSVPSEFSAGAQKQIIPSGETAVINPQLAPQNNVYEITVRALIPGNSMPLYSNVFGLDKNVRYLVLIVPSTDSPNKTEVKFLGESVNAMRSDN